MIPYGRHDITQADIDSVVGVLNSDFLTQGPQVPRFEKSLGSYCGVDHAVAVNSATSALHIACLALGLGEGDWLWTSPITFVASSNCGLYCGAKVDFVDIDAATFNLCPEALSEKLKLAERDGRLPKVVVAVHLSGQSCDMEAIFRLSQQYGFRIIEDASHAIGGKYQGEPVGSCRFSDIAVFSFHPVKIITTAEGGAAVTNDHDLAQSMMLYRSHGITRNKEQMTRTQEGPWYYEQITLGYNYRMTELQAALGVSQLDRLDAYVERRHEIARAYENHLVDLPVVAQARLAYTYSAYHLYIIRLKLDAIERTHRQVFEALRDQGIGVNLHYIPVHTQPFYQQMEFKVGDLTNAERYYAEAISLPMFPAFSEADLFNVVDALKRALWQ